MSTLATFLISMAGPLVLRALLVLGIGSVTFVGVQAGIDGLVSSAVSGWSSLPSAVLQLSTLAGFPEGLGLIAGAMVARTSLWAAASASRFVLNK